MTIERFYPIGIPGEPWADVHKAEWLQTQKVRRSYRTEVLDKLDLLRAKFEVQQYGALSIDPERYPLFAVLPLEVQPDAPWVMITGGVHGYETSGVQGALAFLGTAAADYAGRVNLVAAPCVSPWGYEVINRWNPQAIDPNRSFVPDSPAEEPRALMQFIASLKAQRGLEFLVHLDLHETTDSDESEFRPALAARDGKAFQPSGIPDGFYTVGDGANPQPEFQAAIIRGVEAVTHIAPPDQNGQIIGSDVTQHGVINYPYESSGLCGSLTKARFTSTTEVYPDSDRVTDADCNRAQVAAVRAALDHALAAANS